MKCFYHKSDLDGHCSGAIVKYKHPGCEMVGMGYDTPLDKESILPGETIFVVDFSFTTEEMIWLNDMTDLIWIDHHITAMEKLAGEYIIGSREIGLAACELTWTFLFNTPMPSAVRLLGRHDVWDHKDPNVALFQYGMREVEDTLPESEIWKDLFEDDENIEDMLMTGEVIQRYQAKQDTIVARGMSFETEFHGYNAICINRPYSNSKIFDSVYDPAKHDIMIIFGVKPGEFKYSIYCDKPEIDVSKIAVEYGGGGHRGAAGFYSEKLLF